MEYRTLGGSGLRVSVLTMGTMTFGGKGEFTDVGSTGLVEARRRSATGVAAAEFAHEVQQAVRRSS